MPGRANRLARLHRDAQATSKSVTTRESDGSAACSAVIYRQWLGYWLQNLPCAASLASPALPARVLNTLPSRLIITG